MSVSHTAQGARHSQAKASTCKQHMSSRLKTPAFPSRPLALLVAVLVPDQSMLQERESS